MIRKILDWMLNSFEWIMWKMEGSPNRDWYEDQYPTHPHEDITEITMQTTPRAQMDRREGDRRSSERRTPDIKVVE
jgi:hypothetical protein